VSVVPPLDVMLVVDLLMERSVMSHSTKTEVKIQASLQSNIYKNILYMVYSILYAE